MPVRKPSQEFIVHHFNQILRTSSRVSSKLNIDQAQDGTRRTLYENVSIIAVALQEDKIRALKTWQSFAQVATGE